MIAGLRALRTYFTRLGAALPTVNGSKHGQVNIKQASVTEDEAYLVLRDSSGVLQYRRLVTTTLGSTLYGAPLLVQEGGVTVDAAVDTLNFDASDFNVTEGAENYISLALAYGTSAGTPAEGNHLHDSTYVNVTGDTMTGGLELSLNSATAFVIHDTNSAQDLLIFDSAAFLFHILESTTVIGSDGAGVEKWRLDSSNGNIRFEGALDHNGTTVGLFGVTPAVRPSAYTVTNLVTDRAYDANATSTAELADVLGTLIADLRTLGIVQ
jgi:hypothetical protein